MECIVIYSIFKENFLLHILKINLASKEFAFSVHFISLRVDDLNLVDSCNCRH